MGRAVYLPAQPARQLLVRVAADRQLSVSGLAVYLGINRSTLYRLRSRDEVRYDAADHLAVALGRHPVEIWPEWFDARPGEERRR
jgi:lambda repressor-like predicted transcriptional regulator